MPHSFSIWYRVILLVIGLGAGSAAIAQGFDIEQATAAYLSQVPQQDVANTNAYVNTGYLIMVLTTVLDVLTAFAVPHFGWSSRWRDRAERIFKRKFL